MIGSTSLKLYIVYDVYIIYDVRGYIGYLVTYGAIPVVAEKLLPKLYGVDIGKRGLGGPNDGEKVPER